MTDMKQNIEIIRDGRKLHLFINGKEIHNVRNFSIEQDSADSVPVLNVSIFAPCLEKFYSRIEPDKNGIKAWND